jgi:predicted ATPase
MEELGMVLYERLFGELPFKGDYEQAIIYSIINEDIKISSDVKNDLSDELVKTVYKCLQKNPNDRFQSVGEILEALQDDSSESLSKVTKSTNHNLPVLLTSFIGRKKEIETVKQFLTEHRLVTLTGAGGCGKTRLALQVVQDKIHDFADGVWLVDFAPLSDAKRIPEVVASVLQIKEEPNVPLEKTIINTIKDKNLLILLDNCEHFITTCAEFTEKLMKSVPSITILITSREALNIPGELAWRVPSLSLPKMDLIHKFEEISKFESIELFQDRAKSSLPSFQLTDQNIEAIIKICQRLDGIPLAIELAAARIKLFSPEAILQRLDNRFQLLTGGSRTALERQKTLKATIDWSYDLLSDREKILFNRLSVFVGGCEMVAAEKICGKEPLTEANIFKLLSGLIDKSLVVTKIQNSGSYRYRLLETIRHYAGEKLYESKEMEMIRDSHFKYYLDVAENAYNNRFDNTAAWLDQLNTEHENLLMALEWASRNPLQQLKMSGALSWFWETYSRQTTGIFYLKKAMAECDSSGPEMARALYGMALLLRSMACFETTDYINKSLELWRSLGDKKQIALLLQEMGTLECMAGDYTKGFPHLQECMDIFKELGDKRLLIRGKTWFPFGYVSQLDAEHAEPILIEALEEVKELNMTMEILQSRHFLADCAIIKEDYQLAEKRYAKNLQAYQQLDMLDGVANELQGIAMAVAGQGKYSKALRLNAAAEEMYKEVGISVDDIVFWRKILDKTVGNGRRKMGENVSKKLEQEGRELGFEKAIENALDLNKDQFEHGVNL